MVEVGIKELKNSLSRYIGRVARGERVCVTLRGRPVAEIVPAGRTLDYDHWQRLVAEGRVTPGRGQLPREAPPLEQAATPPSAAVLAERGEER